MENLIWLNDGLVEESKAQVSVYDHGFLYGDGLFETLHVYNGKVFAMDEHLKRLNDSLAVLKMDIPWSDAELKDIIEKTVAANKIDGLGSVRMTITRGKGPLGLNPAICEKPTLVVMAKKAEPYPEEMRQNGVDVMITKVRRTATDTKLPQLKSLNFLNNILAKMEVVESGAFEGLMCDAVGYLTEGTVSNFFIVQHDCLVTPPVSAGLLPGVTRQLVIECAKRLGINVVETHVTWFDLEHAKEAFLTNSSLEVMPIRKVDDVVIADGKPGEMTQKLALEFKKLIAENR